MPILVKGSGGGAQKAPTISVSSGGLITATAGGKSSTKQLSTQGAKTVTPTDYEQTVVNAGVYTTGAVKVAAATVTPTTVETSATSEWDFSLKTGVITFNCDGITPSSRILGAFGVCNKSGNTASLCIAFEPPNEYQNGTFWFLNPLDGDEFITSGRSAEVGYGTIRLESSDFSQQGGDDCQLTISFI